MNMSTSECESGWTMYLDQSLNSWSYVGAKQHGEEEDDDDLSMVSDASSGPRQKFDEDEGKVSGERKKTRSKKEKRFGDVDDDDDTASSPVFTSTSSKSKSGRFKKTSSVAEKCTSKNKQGAINEVSMKKGRDCGAQGSREELGSTNVIATQHNLKY